MTTNQASPGKSPSGFLALIERIGNKVPDITILFVIAFFVVGILSMFLCHVDFGYVNPANGKPIVIANVFSAKALVTLMSKMVTNFATFPPLGLVVVATFGVGIADGSGYLNVALKKLLLVTPKKLLVPAILVAGMISHLGMGSGYIIIIPIASYMFYASGRHPLAGIAVSFAGIAGAFAANYTPSPIDPVIQGFSQAAAQIIDPHYLVNVLCNYYYSIVATFLVIPTCWFVTDKIVEPGLWKMYPLSKDLEVENDTDTAITPRENRAFYIATGVLVLMGIGLMMSILPANSLWRGADGNIASFGSPLMKSIISLIFVFFGAIGVVFGVLSGHWKSSKDFTAAMEKMGHMIVPLIVFYFVAAQFLYIFNTSHMGALIAVAGAELLKSLALPPQLTVFGVIIFVGLLDLLITSASGKWAILAPILVPMLMGVGISPELTQAAFRSADSAFNVVTPMFAFYPLIITFCQKYVKESGIGTLSSMMLPYTIGLTLAFSATIYLMWFLGIPLGIQGNFVYPRPF